MGTVAAVDEKRGLDRELAEARTLIEQGKYETAIDLLESVREEAWARDDEAALARVRGLSRLVSRRAPRGSATAERANSLELEVLQGVRPQAHDLDSGSDGDRVTVGRRSTAWWPWIALEVAVGGALIAFVCLNVMASWADEIGTPEYDQGAAEHGLAGVIILYTGLLTATVGLLGGVTGALAAAFLGSWRSILTCCMLSLLVALMSLVMFGGVWF